MSTMRKIADWQDQVIEDSIANGDSNFKTTAKAAGVGAVEGTFWGLAFVGFVFDLALTAFIVYDKVKK